MAYIQNIEIPTSSSIKFITEYSFNTTSATVQIDERFNTILYIADLETNDIIYNPLKKGSGGTLSGNKIILDFPMDGLSDSDKLLIAVNDIVVTSIDSELELIKKELKYLNKQISKIYQ